MDGMHDLGGKQGFGAVRYSPNAHGVPRAVGEARQRALRARGAGSASSTWTSTATRSSAWSRATTSRRATTSARSPASPRCASRRASSRARSSSAAPAAHSRSRCAERAGPHQRRRTRERFKPGDRVRVTRRLRAGPHAHARLHPRQGRRRGGRIAGLSVSRCARARRRGRGRADLRRALQQPRSCGRTRPTPALVHVGVFQSYLKPRGLTVARYAGLRMARRRRRPDTRTRDARERSRL